MQTPATIPGYDLLTRLGGGMVTSVFKARELATDTICAVKILRADWEDQSMAIKLLQREARAGLAVEHAHLLPLRHAHVMKPPYFLVMDLLAGESLRDRLRRDYRLSSSEAIWITRQVAEGLAALHRKGFIHGDVKPDNIFLTEDSNAILLDLGFAHRPGENRALLESGYILGTLDYLAPELCSLDPIDVRGADVFSLGSTLFEMLAGRLPYPRGTVRESIRRRQTEEPADIRSCRRNLPPTLVKLLHRMLSRQPEQRPKATAVIQQLIALEIAAMQLDQVA